jgi:hypothetical protein
MTSKHAEELSSKLATSTSLDDADLQNVRNLLKQWSLEEKPLVPRSPTIAPPRVFTGKREDLTDFLTQVKMNIMIQSDRSWTEQSKICYLCSFLDGPAFSWAQPYIEIMGTEEESSLMKNYFLFIQELRNASGEPDMIATAEQQLSSLRQGNNPTAEYAVTFRRLAARTGWNDQPLLFQFRKGLSEQLKDELATRDMPIDFNEYIQRVILLDNRIRERQMERTIRNRSRQTINITNFAPLQRASDTNRPETTNDDVRPMELDASRRGPLSTERKGEAYEEPSMLVLWTRRSPSEQLPIKVPSTQ